MKKSFFLLPLLSIIFLFAGCAKQAPAETCPIGSGNFSCWSTSSWTTVWTLNHSDFTGSLSTVLSALKAQDFAVLSQYVGPQWLRFSPYEHVNTGTDIILSTEEVANGLSISRSYIRGAYDGSGEPIDLWIGQYFEKFVNDADYENAPEIFYNQSIQRGNIINNISQSYAGKQWTEFHYSGFDPQYQGMDWKSLTLVFDNVGGQWYLIGVVHGVWTI
ncbi:MAG: hypothetical protein ACD_80C00142G0019 [uncultured bacterium (gcode 4)]|uniref:Lipoprotein n=1 Tax=uncultured bacterium (gcode 4) TaxID=1234023 RepID=K1XIH9_9BACT|nr:MAG: hypothetical protein ACD_80C00142G0019 [uncultured bacterium (gcode 4)]